MPMLQSHMAIHCHAATKPSSPTAAPRTLTTSGSCCCSEGSIQVRDNIHLPELRQQIIQMFFKHLTSPDEAIIATAQQGLAHVISNHKMPKGLLQMSLRPILVNLAYHNKLKLPLLKGLARLLQLLASWFNVTLGKPKSVCNPTHGTHWPMTQCP